MNEIEYAEKLKQLNDLDRANAALRGEVALLREELASERAKTVEWFIAAQEIRAVAQELVDAKGRYHTKKAYDKLESILRDSASAPSPS